MKSLVIFNDSTCKEFSYDDILDEFLNTNTVNEHGEKLLRLNTKVAHYSTVGIPPIRIGDNASDNVVLKDALAQIDIYPNYIEVLNDTYVYLNGKKISTGKHFINVGDSLWAGDTNFIFHNNYISCKGENYSSNLNISTHTPEYYEEFPIYKRSPRIIKRQPIDNVEISAPKNKEEPKKGELFRVVIPPLVMLMMTITTGVMMGRGFFVFASAGMMSVSIIFAIVRFFSDTKERKQKEEERISSYDTY